jgi:hypothetical protein
MDRAGDPRRFPLSVVQCKRCGMGYLNPGYTNAGLAYLFEGMGSSLHSPTSWNRDQLSWLTSLESIHLPSMTVLDYGSGSGHFAELASTVARGVYTVDVDEACEPDYLLRNAVDPELSALPQVDLVCMWHVLEHCPNPTSVLSQLRDVARFLALEVPIADLATEPDITGFFAAVQHSLFPTEGTLLRLLNGAGWDVVAYTYPSDADDACCDAIRLLLSRSQGGAPPEAFLRHPLKVMALARSRREASRRHIEWKLGQCMLDRAVLFGSGWHTEILRAEFPWLTERNGRPLLVDSDPGKHGQRWRGIEVLPTEALRELDWTQHHLILSSYRYWPEMRERALELGAPDDRIISLYEVE